MMNKAEAISLVQEAFGADYSAQAFERFVSNLFKGEYTPLDKRRDGQYVREAFRSFVQGYRILGTYQDAEGSSLDILEVTLQRENSLDRARTAQRNFVADYLKKNDRNAALVAFLSPDQHDWRFSLVKLEYSLEVKDGKLKTEEELTPAKRWSFLIGRHEGSHTVQSRFVSLLQDGQKPLLKELEEAFDIESVTDEFFKKYCELFFRMKEGLDNLLARDPAIKEDFEAKELTSVDFAKKTLGQMAFLYFLQKKGWFGVFPGKPWGTGPKDFLRRLFEQREKYGKNFFDDVLEPLFYEALAQDRGVEAIYPRLNNCRMPFLNGGLFEPMNGYAWETTNIRLPDELFSNSNRTPEGDEGDGILDVFDRYNFTVNESEPLEKEVAVDPEMLGKVFENLLEVKDRKSKGTFYTPREIVHFMCQESLINYLSIELKDAVPREDIEALIRNGSQIIQNDAVVLEKGREGTYKFMLPESIRARAQELDHALASIKVCDPAVGSGAFPLGMLNEIVQARQALGVHLRSDRSVFDLKLHSISHSLYGVDIDPGAVEIAKLRLWLALVVEEDEPHPLPNLEHKVMQGNSLLSEYEGIKLFDGSFLDHEDISAQERAQIESRLSALQREYFALHSEDKLSDIKKREIEREIKTLTGRKKSLFRSEDYSDQESINFDAPTKHREAQAKTALLQRKIETFISESRRSEKQKLKSEIDTLKWELIESTLREKENYNLIQEVQRLRRKNIRPFFIWQLEFSEVFSKNSGFDIVIGNPPYVNAAKHTKSSPSERKAIRSKYPLSQGAFDLYSIFVLLAMEITDKHNNYAWIIPNGFLVSDYSRNILQHAKNNGLYQIVDVSTFNVFDKIGVYPIIIQSRPFSEHFHQLNINSKFDLEGRNYTSRAELPIHKTLKDYGVGIASGTTGFQAQHIIPLIKSAQEGERIGSIPFAVSGSIDPYRIDTSKVRYMKKLYEYPEIIFDPDILAQRKWNFWCSPKIIIAGMTKRLEAVYNDQPMALGVGCYAIFEFGGFDPQFLVGLLNSEYVSSYLRQKFKDKHLAGGYLAINKSTIEQLPMADVTNEQQQAISEYVRGIDELIKNNCNDAELQPLLAEIERCVRDILDVKE